MIELQELPKEFAPSHHTTETDKITGEVFGRLSLSGRFILGPVLAAYRQRDSLAKIYPAAAAPALGARHLSEAALDINRALEVNINMAIATKFTTMLIEWFFSVFFAPTC